MWFDKIITKVKQGAVLLPHDVVVYVESSHSVTAWLLPI